MGQARARMLKRGYRPKEADIQKAILAYLSASKRGLWWPNKTTGTYDPVSGRFRAGTTYRGPADIIGVLNGRHVELEVKTPQRRSQQSEDQKAHQARVEAEGGYYAVVTSIEDAEQAIREAMG